MLLFLLLTSATFSPLAQAEKLKLEKFIRETEELATATGAHLAPLLDEAGRRPSSQRPEIERGDVTGLGGRTKAALDPLLATLRERRDCELPSRGQVLLTTVEIDALIAEGRRVEASLAADVDRILRANDGASLAMQRGRATLRAYLENLAELRTWVNTSQVEGLTSELIALHPRCAGRVVAGGLLRRAPGASENDAAERAKNLGKLRFDMDVSQVFSGSGD